MQVGETAELRVDFVGCGFAADQMYITTNPTVGVLEPIVSGSPPGVNAAVLRALTPGELSVSVEFRGPDGVRHRTTTAYCQSEAEHPGSGGGCSNPKKIGIVRVVL